MLYLDSSATAPLLPEVRDAMLEVMNLSVDRRLSNPSSLHSAGVLGREIIKHAKSSVARLLGSAPEEIIFTSGGTESNNTVLATFRNHPILASAVEHPSVTKPAEKYGKPFLKIPVDQQGIIDLNFLNRSLETIFNETPHFNEKPTLVSIMLANNETGTLEPLERVKNTLDSFKKRGWTNLFFHTDATQAVGKMAFNVKSLDIDYLTFSAHKLGGPVGIGVLYKKKTAPLSPLLLGGSQERHLRAGTENALLAAGLRAAADFALDRQTWETYESRVRPLRDYLAEQLVKIIPTVKIITPLSASLPNVLCVAFPAVEGESTQLYLDLEKIAVSTGSACASGDIEPSPVLMALFADPEIAHNSVRFSLDLTTKKSDLDRLLEKLPPIISRLENLSTIKLIKPKGQNA